LGDREIADVLEKWREQERRLSQSDPDELGYQELAREVDRLREEYQRLSSTATASAEESS
jgi:hypothetical protein